MKMTKAYTNQEFLMGEEARGIRILAEYMEPKDRLARNGVKRAIIMFGSARTRRLQPAHGKTTAPDYYALAADLAERFARWTTDHHQGDERYFLVTGGGPGIMEAANKGAARGRAASAAPRAIVTTPSRRPWARNTGVCALAAWRSAAVLSACGR